MVEKGSIPEVPGGLVTGSNGHSALLGADRALDRAPGRVVGQPRAQAPQLARGRIGVGGLTAAEARHAAERRAVVAVKRPAHLAVLGRLVAPAHLLPTGRRIETAPAPTANCPGVCLNDNRAALIAPVVALGIVASFVVAAN
jgi:hypothetical protein